ncbi:MAG: hypothetical protein JHC95_22860 [Solirubrobacteraceae bacterium]|nr:hypothetical protein [Solirubrobacteraceae bacterium]
MSRNMVFCAIALVAALAIPSAADAATKSQYLVSLGDSYAAGYQATGIGTGKNTRNGFAYQVPGLAKKRGYKLKLVNFGCGGATTTSILGEKLKAGAKCLGPGAPTFTGTQIAAAEKFLKANRDEVGLVTVSIGGNDVTACAKAESAVDCVGKAIPKLEKNVKALVKRLRAAAGPKVRITGITYPDVILGAWVGENPNQDLAKLSVVAFKSLMNPALKKAYEGVDGKFVDVTTATGAYTPLEQTTELAPYGVIPTAVAEACRLSFYCQYRDIHATTEGYRIIADLVAKTLPKK